MTKVLGISINFETVVIFAVGVVAGRWILPAIAHGMASTQGDPGFYTAVGHHHCRKGTPGCICTDKSKCGGQGGGGGGGHGGGSGGGHGHHGGGSGGGGGYGG